MPRLKTRALVFGLLCAFAVALAPPSAEAQTNRVIGVYFRPNNKSFSNHKRNDVFYAMSQITNHMGRQVRGPMKTVGRAYVAVSDRPDSFFTMGATVLNRPTDRVRNLSRSNKMLLACDITIDRAVAFRNSGLGMYSDFGGIDARNIDAIGGGAHELGHMFNLGHPSTNQGGRLMWRSYNLRTGGNLIESEVNEVRRSSRRFFYRFN